MASVQQGYMVLYDYMVPPLEDGSYRMTVSTDVTVQGTPQTLNARQSFFNVDGPRFTLAPTEVAGVFPPRNGHGPFDDAIPHIALYRRTLPWERELDSDNLIGNVKNPVTVDPVTGLPQQPSHDTGLPWLALLLFEESEVTLLKNLPLEQVVPAQVFTRLGSPAGIRCDAIEADYTLVSSIMPSKEELQLLAHVRQVNVDDRELAAGDSDGYFAVVMGNRLATPNTKFVACLVSLEQRSDLVAADPPKDVDLSQILNAPILQAQTFGAVHAAAPAALAAPAAAVAVVAKTSSEFMPGKFDKVIFRPVTRIVCLHSWRFECEGTGTFRALMQRLDVGMIGKVASVGAPALTDTAHLKVNMQDRAGVKEQVLYRGPLVPFPLTRDPLGPYHCADQARRVAPDGGAEDVSYAAAFEVGRLLASADARLGQELMRWRRGAFQGAVVKDSVADLSTKFSMVVPEANVPLPPYVALHAVETIVKEPLPQADVYGLDKLGSVPGLNPKVVQKTLSLPTLEQAISLVGGERSALGAAVQPPAAVAPGPQTLDEVVKDAAALNRLETVRATMIDNVKFQAKLGSKQ
jgi:hypothetical protein